VSDLRGREAVRAPERHLRAAVHPSTHLLRQGGNAKQRGKLRLAPARADVKRAHDVVLLWDGTNLFRLRGVDRDRRVEERVEQRVRGDDLEACEGWE
jgi:hypothetical protein